MKKTFLLTLSLVLVLGADAQAKQPDLPKEHGKAVMPALNSPDMQRAEEVKKALDAETAEPSLADQVAEKVKAVLDDAAKAARAVKDEVQKGDPKTDYSRDENRLHSEKQSTPVFRLHGMLDLSGWTSMSSLYTSTTVVVTYNYAPSRKNPFNTVVVTFDQATGEPLSATGSMTKNLSAAPDLTGMTLVFSAKRSDGTLAYQTYESLPPGPSGETTRVTVYYDWTGVNVSSARESFVQPLDLNKIKLP